MEKPTAPISLRNVGDKDIPFIFSSWLRSYRETRCAKTLDNATYYEGQHTVIERILGRDGVQIIVATAEDDADQILGYIVYELVGTSLTIHWTYVKLPFRNFAIGRRLIQTVADLAGQPDKITVTHLPKLEKKIYERTNLIYNPYKAWIS